MVSYVEQPHRVKTSKLFGVLSLKSQNRLAASTTIKDDVDSDTVKAMQNRMLHKALHDRYQPIETDSSPFATKTMTRTTRRPQFSNVRPPRGTLSDDKLPYLDWRLSILHLQQVQFEEEAERLYQSNVQHFSRLSLEQHQQQQQPQHHLLPTHTKPIAMKKQKSIISTSNGSDLDSDLSSRQGTDDYLNTTYYSQQDSRHSSSSDSNGSNKPTYSMSTAMYLDDKYANSVLHQNMLTNEALATIPILHQEEHFSSIDSTNEDSTNGEEEEDADASEVNELYYEAVERLDRNTFSHVPAPIRSTSLHQNSIADGGIPPSIITTRKLPKMFSRTPRRPNLASRSQSHGPLCASINKQHHHFADVQYQCCSSNEKTKKKWNLLSLHNLGGSEAMIRESELLL